MANPFTDERRDERWELGLPELNMQQLRAPHVLDWLRFEAKPGETPLGTYALKAMFDTALIGLIVAGKYRIVIALLVRTWPELLTGVSVPDNGQKPLAKVSAR